MRSAAFPGRRPNAAPGPRSTSKTTAGRKAARASGDARTGPRPVRADAWVVRRQRGDRRQRDPSPQKRLLERVGRGEREEMRIACLVCAAFAVLASTATLRAAETPGKLELEAAELAADLLGAPVHAGDGSIIGEVADVSFGEEVHPLRVRITMAAVMGLGARTVELPKDSFTVLRGAVVVHLPLAALQQLSSEGPEDDK
jgi:hypothetical protein